MTRLNNTRQLRREKMLAGLEFQDDIQMKIHALYATRKIAYARPPGLPRNPLPVLRELHSLLLRRRCSVTALAVLSGVSKATINGWFREKAPSYFLLEVCFNALGFQFKIHPISKETSSTSTSNVEAAVHSTSLSPDGGEGLRHEEPV